RRAGRTIAYEAVLLTLSLRRSHARRAARCARNRRMSPPLLPAGELASEGARRAGRTIAYEAVLLTLSLRRSHARRAARCARNRAHLGISDVISEVLRRSTPGCRVDETRVLTP